jgi:hypothetical protein
VGFAQDGSLVDAQQRAVGAAQPRLSLRTSGGSIRVMADGDCRADRQVLCAPLQLADGGAPPRSAMPG